MHRLARSSVLAALALVSCGGLAQYPPTLRVISTADAGHGSLREVLSGVGTSVPAGSRVVFDLAFPATITLASPLPTITADLTIEGPGRGALEISGGGIVRPFVVDGGATLSISNLTILDGLAQGGAGQDGEGGGILVEDGRVEATNVLFFQNRAIGGAGADGSGGGIYLRSGSLLLVGAFFVENEALRGAGGFGKGGGVYVLSGMVEFHAGNVFDDNVASDPAGTASDDDDVFGFPHP